MYDSAPDEAVSVAAETSRLHRLTAPQKSRIEVTGRSIFILDTTGAITAELPVSELDEIMLERGLLWSGISFRLTDGSSYSVGGLPHEDARKIRARCRDEVVRYASTVREPLSALVESVSRVLIDTRYTRHSEGERLYATLEADLSGIGREVRKSLADSETQALDHLAHLKDRPAFEDARCNSNDAYMRNVLPSVKDAARPVRLTDEQAVAIATDEDATLVLAGAGTGKTSVIVGKVTHLVRNMDVPPEEILVIAYNRKASEEVRERLSEDLRGAAVFTFHALGRRIIAETDNAAPSISRIASDGYMSLRAFDGILKALLRDPGQAREVLEFIANHQASYRSAFTFKTPAEYDEYVRQVEIRALSGDRVRSFEELLIANHLTEYGVRFRYERNYPVETADRQHSQYRPDFYLPEHDIYIEHFALDESGQPPEGWSTYLQGVEWKRSIHRQYGTTLLETYSWQSRQDRLLAELRKNLEGKGVKFERQSVEALVSKLGQHRITWLAGLIATFLNHVKERQLTGDVLSDRIERLGDKERGRGFPDVFEQVHGRYERALRDERAVDFHDLINRAASLVSGGRWDHSYRHILVDEFQDISAGRMNLLASLRKPSVAYFLVGDDWQSIYRFAGSDVRIMRNGVDHLGFVQERTLSRTFRYGSGILDPSSAFIKRNPEQTQRPLRSVGSVDDNGITVVSARTPASGLRSALQDMRDHVKVDTGSVLVLGRYRRSREHLPKEADDSLLSLEFSTIHAAKGREADFVIVLDLTDRYHGFPSRVEDDALLTLVLPENEEGAYSFAEERRLFYVALTRARRGVYLITDERHPSPFVTELLKQSKGLRQIGEFAPECPRCGGGKLVPARHGQSLRCSRGQDCGCIAPICTGCGQGYVIITEKGQPSCTNSGCKNPPSACPQCGFGVLVRRKGPYGPFFACSESFSLVRCGYKRDPNRRRRNSRGRGRRR
ncbi:MAG: UvrD-helicase domain-containing protein [Dehalococcoidia bacterium]|nr:UvrD-helicase domain-containing protein [Dehalococcoidia bacterium]